MKQLLVLRHAKSSWDDLALADIDRPLARRGKQAARRVGALMAARGWLPQRALVSPAKRTRETWDILSGQWRSVPEFSFAETLYAAPAARLLAEARRTPDRVGVLLLLGHNPGLEDFARNLVSADSDVAAVEHLRDKFPTAALARLEFDGGWDGLHFGRARLTHCLWPKDFT